ncbi:hypothetical protein I550_1296 [Mycobacterium intracellulare 1956]|uniref:Uncharacterized protein n=1 Tax=Mycobacterium intracellulare 1956 TaxID=1299331 RepID=X8CQ57_MYCIT|nr:hypothetical protein I550_1296 [Mycobacterium intracellulare 1956]
MEVYGAQRIVGRGSRQRLDQSSDHQLRQRVTPGWAIKRHP